MRVGQDFRTPGSLVTGGANRVDERCHAERTFTAEESAVDGVFQEGALHVPICVTEFC